MPTSRQVLALTLLAFIVTCDVERAARADEAAPANVAAARRHYERARADYEQGAYKEAIAELEAAHALDPTAKDLVFNLAVVHEKLADVDEALRWFRVYETMKLTPQEADRAEAYVRRLEGAKHELEAKQSPPPPQAATPVQPPPPPTQRASWVAEGRIDTATIAATGTAGAGLLFGVALGIKAKSDQPSSNYVTGENGTYEDLTDQARSAHREAVLADVGFGVFVLGAAAAAYLFFSRPRAAAPTTRGATPRGATLELVPPGGALRLGGTF
jgi:tetratricopeptide (TPR) repeat protein